MEKIKKTFRGKSHKILFACMFLMALLGHVLNILWEHRYFYFNQYFLFVMLVIQLYVLGKIDMENLEIEKALKERKEMEVWGSFNTKTNKLIHTLKINIISIILVFVYIFTMFKVGCLEYTFTGFYGGLLGALVFYIGIQAYLKYLMLLHFSWDLKNLHIKNYFFYIPALTDWIVRLAREFSYIEKWFLILGLMYSSIYAINIPVGAITINNGISFQTSSNFLFFLTWIGIIIFFALAVPVFTFLSRYFIKECIGQCKCISIKKLEKQIGILSNNASEEDLNSIQTKLSLIKEISLSEEYPLRYSHTIFDKIYTVNLALLTLISPFISIIEQIIFKG